MLTRARVLRSLGAGALIIGRPTVTLAQTPVSVTVGSGITEGNAQAFYALDEGFFRKNGIDAQLTFLRSGGPIMEAIAAGQLEVGSGNSVSAGSAILKGIPFIVIAPGQVWVAGSPEAAIVVAANSPIKSIKDFAGKTVATISLRNVGELAFDAYLDQAGVDLNSVKFVELPPMQIADAIVSGRVAAGTLIDPQLSSAVAAGKVRRLASAYDAISKLFYLTIWFANRVWVDRNKETTKRFADAIIQGGVWAETNGEQARLILAKYTKVTEEKTNARWGHSLDPALLQSIWDASYKYKIFGGPLRAADYCWTGK
jgi:NitT/TauT family transport system substrate-binding protein